MFVGQEPEKCLDWINRIKNICSQAGHSLHQELMNKSEMVVQNFIRNMGDTWTDEEVIEEILKYFSDIPTPAHAITKLRALIQGEGRSNCHVQPKIQDTSRESGKETSGKD